MPALVQLRLQTYPKHKPSEALRLWMKGNVFQCPTHGCRTRRVKPLKLKAYFISQYFWRNLKYLALSKSTTATTLQDIAASMKRVGPETENSLIHLQPVFSTLFIVQAHATARKEKLRSGDSLTQVGMFYQTCFLSGLDFLQKGCDFNIVIKPYQKIRKC